MTGHNGFRNELDKVRKLSTIILCLACNIKLSWLYKTVYYDVTGRSLTRTPLALQIFHHLLGFHPSWADMSNSMDPKVGSMIPDLSTNCNIGSMTQSDLMVEFHSRSWIPLDPSVKFGIGSRIPLDP